MKKILIEGMSNNLGGMETFIHLLFKVLHSQWQVDFLVFDDHIPFQQEYIDAGCQIHWITPRSKGVSAYKKDIDALFKEGNYDVFWFNKTTLSSIYSLKSARKHNVRKVVCHSHTSKNMGSKFTACMHGWNRHFVSRYIDYKLACSQDAATYFFGEDSDVLVLKNAVDLDLYEPDALKREIMKEKLGVKDAFVIGHVGRFSPEKNHTFLIDVFEKIAKQENAHLILCGTGPLQSEIEEKICKKHLEGRVHLLGMRNDIPDVLQAIDVLVMPSLFEGLPFSLVEAQAAGVPCIVSDTVSLDSKLTDIIHFVPLDAGLEVWCQQILEYKNYQKVSKKDLLDEKGFSFESFSKKVNEIIE